ncbi:MAG: hypothetical protein JWL76_1978 [Thermoleophilia bacterium]|nr:hypothetical protein [Thermoleophilia bacterium]
MNPIPDITAFDHVHMVRLSVGAAAIGLTAAWARQLHRRGLIQLERPNPKGRYFIRLDELERISRAEVPVIAQVHTRRLRK